MLLAVDAKGIGDSHFRGGSWTTGAAFPRDEVREDAFSLAEVACARWMLLSAIEDDIEGLAPFTGSTFDLWMKQHPEFSEAVKEATRQSQAWWERKGREATFGGVEGFNATSYIFQMKNRFREDWRDRHDHEHSGRNGGPIQSETRVVIVPPKLAAEVTQRPLLTDGEEGED